VIREEMDKKMGKIRAGIVGAGYVANHHARAIRDLPFVELVGVTDQDPERARLLGAKFNCPVFGNLAEMKAASPEVIHVLTPPASHRALTIEGLQMGCHVFVEKPMAESSAECDEMIAEAKRAGRILSVNHSARFDPVVLEAAELVKSGKLGDILAVHFIRSSDYPPYAGGPLPAPYRQGSYPFRDLGVHGLYLIELFLGPTKDLRVRSYQTGRDPLLTFDEWRAEVDCRDGTGYMFLSWNSRPIQNELLIHGTRGVVHVDCFLQTCELSGTMPGPKQIGMIISGTRNAIRKSFSVPWSLVRFASGKLKPSPGIYRGVQDFYRALEEHKPIPVPAEEGRDAIAWIEKGSQSADLEKAAILRQQASPKREPARILVTGGGGFLGSALVAQLRESGEPIRLLLRRPPEAGSAADPQRQGAPVSIVYGSLGQPEIVDAAMEGIEVVYHVGAAMKGGLAEFEQGTIWGTRNVIEACLKHGVKRLVYVSSMSVMDHAGHVTGDPVKEDSRQEPFPDRRGAYTQTKLEAEHTVLKAMTERGLPAVVIRPGQIFGPGAEKVTPNGVIGIAGRWIVAGGGSRKLPLVYRDDVVDGLIAAATRDEALGQVVNLVDTTPVDQNEYLKRCRPALGKTPVIKAPVFLLMMAAYMIELLGKVLKRNVPLSRYKIRSLKPLYPFDVSRAEKVLGWKPRVGVHKGLERTFPPKT
jgi:predicted dehydrogenase/nucleoside-diphosphate-sugar epimerase